VRFGPFQWGPAILFLFPFGLLTFLVLDNRSGIILKGILAVGSIFLALRACGLQRAKASADTPGGTVSVDANFEDPTESTDR
jgi:hypothetical protein